MKDIGLAVLSILFSTLVYSQDISGDWYGKLEVSGMEIPLIFHLEKEGTTYQSTMDSPKQGAFGLKVSETTYENSNLKMFIPIAGITYEGSYHEGQEVFEGVFKQGGMNLPLVLSRDETILESKPPSRPQEPVAPFPYLSEEVQFSNHTENISLSGTLTLPKKSSDIPVVILISGSGPQDRNSEVFNHKPFLVLADHFTRNGIGVLRFDERGVGESEGNFNTATSKDFASDVLSAVRYLKNRSDIDPSSIGLIGHSEGGIIAPMVAETSPDVDFIVLLAAPGIRGDQNLLLQKKRLEEMSGRDEEGIRQDQLIFKGAYELIENAEISTTGAELKHYFETTTLADRLTEGQLTALVQQLTEPWMIFHLKHNPAKVLEDLRIPVLALFGENDLQVPPTENSEAVEESLARAGNESVKIMILDNLNHLFQESQTGLPDEYEQIEQTFSPVAMQVITDWINHQQTL